MSNQVMIMLNYDKPNLYRCGDLRLVPGMNQVRKSIWDKCKNHPLVKKRLDSGVITIKERKVVKKIVEQVEGKEVEKEETVEQAEYEGNPLQELNVKDAREIIKGTYDKDTLESWKEGEERETIIKAIDKQIEKITPTEDDYRDKKEKDGESEDDDE